MDNLSTELLESNEENKVLFKHVATIHKTNSLSLLQNKVSNVLYFHAYKTIKDKELHTISMGELCNYLSYKGHNYAEIKDALLELIKLVVEWNMLNDSMLDEENWTASAILASASIKNGVVEYSYSYHMRELLADPKIYAAINIAYQANFRSKYGLALYENCVRYVNVKQTPWFDYALLRDLLGVTGDKYPQYKDFKRRVLDVAIDEVNTYSDIRVEPSFKRSARRVSGIKFEIVRRQKKQKIVISHNTPKQINTKIEKSEHKLTTCQSEMLDELERTFQFSPQQALWAVKTYPINFIKEKISFVRAYNGARSACAMLISALKNDYKNSATVHEIEKQQLKKLMNEHSDLKVEVFVDRLKSMKKQNNVERIEDMMRRFENYLRVEYSKQYKAFCKKGILKDRRSSQLCYKFCAEKFPDIFDLIKEME